MGIGRLLLRGDLDTASDSDRTWRIDYPGNEFSVLGSVITEL